MWWPFKRRTQSAPRTGPRANAVFWQQGRAIIDVRGQTCPGYLLAIDHAVGELPAGSEAELLISYPPCGDDVKAWCKEKGITFLELVPDQGIWRIRIRK